MAQRRVVAGSLKYKAAKDALEALDRLTQPDHRVPVEGLAGESMRRAANLVDRIKDCAWGDEVRRRAALLEQETGPGSDFETARARFVETLIAARVAPGEASDPNYLSPRDDRNGFTDYPRRLGQLTDAVRRWGLDLQSRATAGASGTVPPTNGSPAPPGSKKPATPKRLPSPMSVPGHVSPSSLQLAENLRAALQELTARERVNWRWGCYMLQHCHEIARSGSDDWEEQGRLASMWSPFAPALEAMKDAAAFIIEEQLPVVHGADFRSVTWFGVRHAFSPTQADIVHSLWEAWESGTLALSQDALLKAAKSQSARIQDVFKGHTTWRTMVHPSRTKGCWELAIPSSVDSAGNPEWPK